MQYTRLKRNHHSGADQVGIYADFDELVRLQFRARGFSFLPRQPLHSVLSGRHASRLRGRGLNFEELRDYLPGDDIRTIDWKVTARTGKPHVRVYTEERDRPVWLLVDQRLPMFFGSSDKMKSVLAAEVAALSAWRVLSAGDRVGAVVFDDQAVETIRPHRSEASVFQVLNAIVRKNHALRADSDVAANPAMLNEALKTATALVRHDCLVCLISDGFGIDDQTRSLVTRLSQHNDVITIFTYDPLERELQANRRMLFSDGLKQLEVNTAKRSLRDRYTREFEDRMNRLRDTSRRFSIPLLALNTVDPVPDQIRELLGRSAPPRRV